MADTTKIEWCDSTFNPWIGCTKVGPGCDNCYAEALMDKRWHKVQWGSGQQRQRTSAANWKQPLLWERERDAFMLAHGRRRRVFCASLADVFDNETPPQWRGELWALVKATPRLDWLILTKRIGNVPGMAPADGLPPNVWLGASMVNQAEYDRDVRKLLAVDASVRFLSVEPMLGPIHGGLDLHGLDWVIVGGESGPNARPMHVQWARSLVHQCNAAGVPVLVKQLGHTIHDDGMSSPGQHWPGGKVRQALSRQSEADPAFSVTLAHSKGGDWSEWPDGLRVREFPRGAE